MKFVVSVWVPAWWGELVIFWQGETVGVKCDEQEESELSSPLALSLSEWVSEWTHYVMLKSVSYISLLLLSVLIFSLPLGYWLERENERERDHSIGHELHETHTVWEKVCVLEERLMIIQLEPLLTLGQTGSFIMIAKKTIPVYSSLHLSGKNKT